jgi:flagellar motility protein MotE (MotC chaperone)
MVTLSPKKLEKNIRIVSLILGIVVAIMFIVSLLVHINQFPGKVLALSAVNTTTHQNINNTNATITTDNNRTQIISEPAPPRIEPKDLNSNNLTTDMVKTDLSKLTPDEISKYPLKDLSVENLGIILSSLPISDLEKTLSSIKPDDLKEILNKLPQDKVEQILNKLPQDKVEQILNRLSPLSEP